jgi:hypothetical protein
LATAPFDKSHPVEAGDSRLNKAIGFVEVDAVTPVDLKDASNQCGELEREFLRRRPRYSASWKNSDGRGDLKPP